MYGKLQHLLNLLCYCVVTLTLENGKLRTPPMGWMAWGRFMCQINCTNNEPCINETLFLNVAQHLTHDGYAPAGYKRIHIDDCYMEKERDEHKNLKADRHRFPHGIGWLAKKIQEKGLSFGMYLTYGLHSCMGFAGTWSDADIRKDAALIDSIGADYLKFDGCFNQWQDLERGYLTMSQQLTHFENQVAYACSWPFYLLTHKIKPDYEQIADTCNVWRNFYDIQLNWPSVLTIIDFYTRNQEELAKYHGPGHWNDPDMLIIGNRVLTPDQERVQMSFWCLWSAPLIMSNDMNTIPATSRHILLNKHAIAINQDPLGNFGLRIESIDNVDYYIKYLADPYKYALLIFNRNKKQVSVELNPKTIGLFDRLNGKELKFFNVWTFETMVTSNEEIQMRAESVLFYIVSKKRVPWSLLFDIVLISTAFIIFIYLFNARAVNICTRYSIYKLQILYFIIIFIWLFYCLIDYIKNM